MPVSEIRSSLLIAMPQLRDPNFRRGVALIVHHDDEGSFGLVLNRPVELLAGNLCASLDLRWGGDPTANIHWGGPVQPNTGWVLFDDEVGSRSSGEQVTEVTEGVSFAGSLDVLRSVAQAPPEDVRLFLGYAGWGPGQLELELAQGAWLVAPVSRDLIFGVAPETMWNRVLRDLGVDPATLIPTTGVH